MNNNIDLNYVPAAASAPQSQPTEQSRPTDERIWKTRLDKDHKSYSAQVRILPNMKRDAQGNLDYDRANPSPFRKIMVHYLRIGNGEKKYFKCLKTTHEGIKQKGICPYCDWTFNRYFMLKKAADAGDAVPRRLLFWKNLFIFVEIFGRKNGLFERGDHRINRYQIINYLMLSILILPR